MVIANHHKALTLKTEKMVLLLEYCPRIPQPTSCARFPVGPPNLQQHCWGRLVGGSRCSFSAGASSGWSGEMGEAPAWGWN